MDKLNRLSKELTSSFESRTNWIEVLSAINQALPSDERIKGDSVDPNEIPFSDRREIYLESIETKFFKDVAEWYAANKPAFDAQFDKASSEEDGEVKTVKKAAQKAGQDKEAELKGPGWVIEISGYHFHNSSDKIMELGSGVGRSFVINEFLSNFFKEVSFPGQENAIQGGGTYKFEDFGIYLPTLITDFETRKVELPLTVAVNDRANVDMEEVVQYDFIIQMAWVPRSPRERFEARKKREEEDAKKKEADEKAAETAAQKEGN